MVLQQRLREIRVREIRVKLLEATRSPTPTGALLLLKEAASQLTILIRIETEGGNFDETETGQGHKTTVETPG